MCSQLDSTVCSSSLRVIAATLAGLAAIAFTQPARAHGGDIAITNINGRIVTGLGDDTQYPSVYEFPERVYASELIDQGGGQIFIDEPGWLGPYDNVGQGFAPGTSLGFNIRRALRAWNGDDFLGGPAAERMRLFDSGPGTNIVFTPLTDVLEPGFAVVADAAVHATGGFDEHPFYGLTTNTPGIYLLELEIWASDPGVATSEPLWIVFNYDSSEFEHDEAIEWVEANLVPAPASLAMLLGVPLMPRRRR